MTCTLGLACDSPCPNRKVCYVWGLPWPLPYAYSAEQKALFVSTTHPALRGGVDVSPFEDFKFDLSKEWERYGFADAVSLPYSYFKKEKSLVVMQDQGGFQKAWRLPYREEIMPEGYRCLTVDYNLCQVWYSLPVCKAGWLIAELINPDEIPF